MYLHEDRKLFRDVIVSTAESLGVALPIVEKDYYVTMILKELSEKCPGCVFKGGTSLSKCHHAIERFSEDVDIAFSGKLTVGQKKQLKYDIIAGISQSLKIPISDFNKARSRRNYNCYTFSYETIENSDLKEILAPGVKLEVTLMTVSFPTEELLVDSYVYQFLSKENMNIVDEYNLNPFKMKVQKMDRTLVDKVFAICDYYMQENTKRCSRHIYDIFMLSSKVKQDDNFRKLVQQVRLHRAELKNCPSAIKGVDVPSLLHQIIENEVYREDYQEVTMYFQINPVDYEEAIVSIQKIADSGMFDENVEGES